MSHLTMHYLHISLLVIHGNITNAKVTICLIFMGADLHCTVPDLAWYFDSYYYFDTTTTLIAITDKNASEPQNKS